MSEGGTSEEFKSPTCRCYQNNSEHLSRANVNGGNGQSPPGGVRRAHGVDCEPVGRTELSGLGPSLDAVVPHRREREMRQRDMDSRRVVTDSPEGRQG